MQISFEINELSLRLSSTEYRFYEIMFLFKSYTFS